MYIGYTWLKDYIKVPFTAEELADKLTMVGLEVGGVSGFQRGLDLCKICQIKEIVPHPNADKLCLCNVDTGYHEISVVCGASNMKLGDKVPLALPGASPPKIGEIKRTKIRGVSSGGMLCSEWELGLGDDRSGLMILPAEAPVGKDLADYFNISDKVLDLDITPNRSDCLSHLGIAREIAAMTGETAKLPEIRFPEEGEAIDNLIEIRIADPDLCFRYVARIITGVTIGPSPSWLAARLESVDIRSINNVVDVTNYVLMETGQPLHAFDYDLIQDKKIIVRPANPKEAFITLDGVERDLDSSMLMIADAGRSIALAGIMGGMESEVTENTKNVLIESALFNPKNTRKTSRKLGLSTEASQRFERGIDPEGVLASANRAVQLILQTAGGKAAKGAVDVYPKRIEKNPIQLRVKRVNMVLGLDLSGDKISGILKNLSFKPLSRRNEEITFLPPSFRQDIFQEEDLIEEVARFYGYDRIPTTLPAGGIPAGEKLSKNQSIETITREILVGAGLYEVINFSFTKKLIFDNIKIGVNEEISVPVKIQNPLTEEYDSLRPSVVPGLIQNIAFNLSRQNPDLKIFELSTCFFPSAEKTTRTIERKRLGIAMVGQKQNRSWRIPERYVDYYDLKGLLELLLEGMGIRNYRFEEVTVPWLDEETSIQIMDNDLRFGILGQLSNNVKDVFDMKRPAFVAELDFDHLVKLARPGRYKFQAIPKFPPVLRDLAVVIDDFITYKQVIDLIREEGGELLKDVLLFDIYVGPQIPKGKKSLAFSLTYRSDMRTLTDEKVNDVHQQIFDRLNFELGAELR
ncbi:MAG: phenylalanine--tRNA ligase subunit beta [bacterium]